MLAVMRHVEQVKGMLDAVPVLLIPLWQVLVFSVLVAVLAIMERNRMCLVVTYIASSYWVFVENLKQLAMNQISAIAVLIFLGLGITILALYIYHGSAQSGKTRSG